MSIPSFRAHNFNAGPAALPLSVLQQIQDELFDFQSTGMSVMEISHRSKTFEALLAKAEASLRAHLNISDDYAVLFIQGGGRMQFSMIPMNFYQGNRPVDFINTDYWTERATDEVKGWGKYRLIFSSEQDRYRRLPKPTEIEIPSDGSYVYLASNNTIAGTQWKQFPKTGAVPLVGDMTSDLLSRPIDVNQFGLIFAGAQKNLGIAGMAVVIVRRDWMAKGNETTIPMFLQYRTHDTHKSMVNTPPTFTIYVLSLVLDWLEKEGGVEVIEKRAHERAEALYHYIDSSGFYHCHVPVSDRSVMNVVFNIQDGNESLETAFTKEAGANRIIGIKGHRAIGGLRVSIYNAQPMASVEILIDFMKTFAKKHG